MNTAAPDSPTHELSSSHNRLMQRKSVLVVFEDATIRELLSVNFRHAGFFPVPAASMSDGQRLANELLPDAIVLDLDAPGADCQPFMALLNPADGARRVPSVMVTSDLGRACGARGEICGATVCLAKPFSAKELVHAVLRQSRSQNWEPRSQPPRREVLKSGPLELDVKERRLVLKLLGRTQVVDLQPIEAKVMHCLLQNPGRIQTRQQIVDAVWGEGHAVELRTVDQYIKRLRQSLNEVNAGSLIQSVRGYGYRVNLPASGWREA